MIETIDSLQKNVYRNYCVHYNALQYFTFQILLCSLLHCTVLADNIDIESEGLLPVYSIDNHNYEEGSGDIEDDKIVVTNCECSKTSTDQLLSRSKFKYSSTLVSFVNMYVIYIYI